MDSFCITPFIQGFGTGAGLIIAIGAQNAFVLKQGILKNHVLVTVLICTIIDVILIALGVGGFGRLLTTSPLLLEGARWGGAAFLLYYGFRSFRSILKTESLAIKNSKSNPPALKETVLTTLALSLLNPHVYLDTVILVGSVGAQYKSFERPIFALGAIIASICWFFSLGFGARYLKPIFSKPLSWKILDFIIGCTMWLIALSLIFGLQNMGCCQDDILPVKRLSD
ncbi:MAG: amino acid transporter [Alphaproteobacteria bacterium]|nr:amino acid transporter [Alphaproteobacteria bacterium]